MQNVKYSSIPLAVKSHIPDTQCSMGGEMQPTINQPFLGSKLKDSPPLPTIHPAWIQPPPSHQDTITHLLICQANSLFKCKNTHQLITFYHVCMFFPIISNWVKAINHHGYVKVWQGLLPNESDASSPSSPKLKRSYGPSLARPPLDNGSVVL